MRDQTEEIGGFIRKSKVGNGGFNRRKASQQFKPNFFKEYDDRVAEEQAARERWAAMPPLVAAREMIANADLSEEATVHLLATVSTMDQDKLEEWISSSKFDQTLVGFASRSTSL